ncbi:EAL domain-containing protein [Rhodoferax ferrireducens]|uniref:EAL domain-containing protein n=1 Tax=Rhodoferax ferrireducens TaxID=192843 RepID=UPI000E0D38FB|nr:EAL domain-containing protein [Rhodoferax ferrireducens]
MNNEKIRPREGVDILIVEDSPTQAEELRFLLERENHHVRVAVNGWLALAAVKESRPTLIITDIVMPEMDGYELCAALKADPALKQIPVVMVTSLSGIQDIAKSLECGADNFIRKPYDQKTLLARVEYILLNLELRKTSRVQMGMEIYMGGQKHFIASGREQIVDMLISTYEEAVHMNDELKAQQREIALANRTLRMLYRIAADLNRGGSEPEVCERALLGVLELPEFRTGWIDLDEGQATMRTFGKTGPAASTMAGNSSHAMRLPLKVGEQSLGILNLLGAESGALSRDTLRTLDAVASQLAVAIQRSQLHEHLESLVAMRTAALQAEIMERIKAEQKVAGLNRVYAVLSGINSAIVRGHDRIELFTEACRIAVELGKFRVAWIGVVEANGTRLRPMAWKSDDDAYGDCEDQFTVAQRDTLDANAGWFGQSVRTRSVAICNDMAAQGGEFFPPDAVSRGCRSQAVFPLRVGGGMAGVLVLCAAEPDFFASEMELDLLKEMAGDIAFALEYIGKAEQLDYLAYYDALTGLANRSLIQDRLNQLLQDHHRATGERTQVGLLLIDIERFKNINDTLGRHVGDVLLKRVAGRLTEAMGNSDRLARLGNAHFAAILGELRDATDVAHLLDDTLLPCLSQPFTVDGKELHLTFLTGVALFPGDGSNVETLFANAETALQLARTGEERYMFYAPRMNARVAQQLLLENKLHRALERDEFVLYYQPKVSLFDGSVVGLEALIRWNDPKSGLVPPNEFIPLLEETGMIVEVGRWVLEKAIADITDWQARGLKPPRVAVNVSAMQLRRKDFVQTLERALTNHHGYRRQLGLDLELTESILMMDVEASIQKLNAIRDMDLKISIDDFGTGYSSLSYLRRFPIDYLKIDQSFVRDITSDPNAASICISIIDLAHNLKLKVIAEGVETEGQMNYLRRHHCDEMQGYLFSRPLPAAECAQLLAMQKKLTLPPLARGERKTLLIIDDETNILSALKRLLHRENYEILTADTADVGFDLLATHEVQVVVSDQRMPEMNGTEFLSRVKDLYPDTVRIVLSGYTDLESITDAVNHGAIYKFFTKPWDDETMRDNIRDAFVTYEARRAGSIALSKKLKN